MRHDVQDIPRRGQGREVLPAPGCSEQPTNMLLHSPTPLNSISTTSLDQHHPPGSKPERKPHAIANNLLSGSAPVAAYPYPGN